MIPPRPLVCGFLALYFTLGVVIAVQSVQTIVDAQRGYLSGHDRAPALILGTIETIAALLFLVPRTMRFGSVSLMIVFTLAFVIHALGGQPNLALLVYAAGVLFIHIHGVKGYRWQATT